MVLQDKYKARASRKYQAKHGGSEGGDAGGASRGRGSGRGRGRGRGRGPTFAERNGLVEPDEEDEDEDEDDESESNGEQGEQNVHTQHTQSDAAPSASSQSSRPKTQSKYSKRKMTSNSWRFEHPSDEEEDPDAEPEPEVDLSRAFEKARLDHYEETHRPQGSEKEGDDEEDDIDTDLAYLHHKAAARAAKPAPQRRIDRPEGYEEAQKANRELRERNDAKMKIWGKLDDGLQARKRGDASTSSSVQVKKDTAEKRVLEGEDYLDSMLG